MKKKTISLCMIIKNEATFIENCLKELKDFVDEMIIVDTGSTDNTIQICNKLGAKVYPYKWDYDFSKARNYSLEKATCEWILWMDADEKIEETDLPKLRQLLDQEPKDNIFSIQLINFHGDPPPNTDRSFIIAHHRLFRNNMGFKFENKIHEQLNINDISPKITEIPKLPIRVYHYGYMESIAKNRKKFERNLNMLEEALHRGDPNPWIPYHIASEYYRIKKYDKAFDYVNKSIMRFIEEGKTPPSLLYKLKYAILLIVGSVDGAYPGIERAIAIYPNYVDLHFYKGIIFFAKKRYKDALKVFHHCIDLGEDHIEHLILRGLGSFQSWYYIGKCEEKLKNIMAAIYAYAKSLTISHSYEPPWNALIKLIKNNHQYFDIDEKQLKELDAPTIETKKMLLEKLEMHAKKKIAKTPV